MGHIPNLALLDFSVKVVRHRVGLWKAVEKVKMTGAVVS